MKKQFPMKRAVTSLKRGAGVESALIESMAGQSCRRGSGGVAHQMLRLSHHFVQLLNKLFEVLQAPLANLPQVLSERDLQLLL